jgi:IS5 family transposase
MRQFAERNNIPIWWDDEEVKSLRREYNMSRNRNNTGEFFFELAIIFSEALRIFGEKVATLTASEREKEKARELLTLLTVFNEQNGQKIAGEKHIKDRIVSLSDPEMRPIKKGKTHPKCEFGTTLQLTFNRDGFMITTENFIGNPGDKKIFADTYDIFTERTESHPVTVVTDGGCRSRSNIENLPPETENVFMGRSSDVCEEERDFCRSARSATEGFIAVAKHFRGFGRCLYRGLKGHRIWSLLCRTAYNLKKFLQLYFADEINEESIIALGNI